MQALFIEVKNWALGERAGIDNSDIEKGNLVSFAGTQHQSLDTMPKGNYEVRIVRDDRDLSQYTGEIVLADGSTVSDPANLTTSDDIVDVNRVVVLENREQINMVIEQGIPERYRLQGDVDVSKISKRLEDNKISTRDWDNYEIRKRAYKNGDERLQKVEPPKVRQRLKREK